MCSQCTQAFLYEFDLRFRNDWVDVGVEIDVIHCFPRVEYLVGIWIPNTTSRRRHRGRNDRWSGWRKPVEMAASTGTLSNRVMVVGVVPNVVWMQ